MIAKEKVLFSKQHSFVSDNTDTGYSNLNLNQNLQCLNVSPIQSQSKSYKEKGSTVSENFEEKGKLQTWNKSSMIGLCSTTLMGFNLKHEVEEAKTRWMKDDISSSTTSSTLSLHISAYENSNEIIPASDSLECQKNSFEFPRQQNDKVTEPEVSQFIASQHLLNPNETSSNISQQRMLPPEISSIKYDYLTDSEIATMVCLAIFTAALTVAAIFSIVECFIPEFITYWKEEQKAKKMIKPMASKEVIAELTAKKEKKRNKKNNKKKAAAKDENNI